MITAVGSLHSGGYNKSACTEDPRSLTPSASLTFSAEGLGGHKPFPSSKYCPTKIVSNHSERGNTGYPVFPEFLGFPILRCSHFQSFQSSSVLQSPSSQAYNCEAERPRRVRTKLGPGRPAQIRNCRLTFPYRLGKVPVIAKLTTPPPSPVCRTAWLVRIQTVLLHFCDA